MRVLVVAPHPDDESVGCGGAVARHTRAGDRIDVVFLTSGEAGGHGKEPAHTRDLREQEARDAAAILGVSDLHFWRQPDGDLAPTAFLLARLRELLAATVPDIVYAPWEHDGHHDHRAAAQLVIEAARHGFRPAEMWGYEIWTPIDRIDHVVDISEVIETKIDAIRAHRSQCLVLPFEAAMRGLARYRGEMFSWPGGPYAEVFRRLAGEPT